MHFTIQLGIEADTIIVIFSPILYVSIQHKLNQIFFFVLYFFLVGKRVFSIEFGVNCDQSWTNDIYRLSGATIWKTYGHGEYGQLQCCYTSFTLTANFNACSSSNARIYLVQSHGSDSFVFDHLKIFSILTNCLTVGSKRTAFQFLHRLC